MTSILVIVTVCYGTVMALSPLLQLRRIRQVGSSRDVSLANLAILAVGGGIWCIYGVSVGSPPLIIANICGLLAAGATLTVARSYRGFPVVTPVSAASLDRQDVAGAPRPGELPA